jgi:hypothetical protein
MTRLQSVKVTDFHHLYRIMTYFYRIMTYFYRIMTYMYFNSLKIMSLNCDAKKEEEKKKNEKKPQ